MMLMLMTINGVNIVNIIATFLVAAFDFTLCEPGPFESHTLSL